jgi:uncharacterized protein
MILHYINKMENLIFSNDIKQALSNLVFEVTDLCNLKCKYCGYGEFYENHDPRKKMYSRSKAQLHGSTT